ncbi:MAG: phosphoribosylamine--glycine ligase [Actinomycetota bacterium]|nr:phosphoribosylamine--glycine ligase [Actinomycetota bacterium]
MQEVKQSTRIVVVGSGGREHAICDVLVREGYHVIATPGNVGISKSAECTDQDPRQLTADLFVIGPEAPLVEGLADDLRAQSKLVFGPGRSGALLEGSKDFMKEVAAAANVPTARYATFTDVDEAISYLSNKVGPYIIKTDGLAAGKGVLVTSDLESAIEDVRAKLSGASFGQAGTKVIIEDFLSGREVSVLAILDGERAVLLPAAADHKRLNDGDLGPNTGGMGAFAPVEWFDESLQQQTMDRIITPVIQELKGRGIDYRGVLYAGLMVNDGGPSLVEFNVRFGDPEAQVVIPLLEGGFGSVLFAAAGGDLSQVDLKPNGAGAVVVMSASGYPNSPRRGDKIVGLAAIEDNSAVRVYHSGTSVDQDGDLVTSGGRVRGITALGKSKEEALERAYAAVSRVAFDGAHYRRDIGVGR